MMDGIFEVNQADPEVLANGLAQYLEVKKSLASHIQGDSAEEVLDAIKSGAQKGYIAILEGKTAGIIFFREFAPNLLISHFYVPPGESSHSIGVKLLLKTVELLSLTPGLHRATGALLPGLVSLTEEELAGTGYKPYERYLMEKMLVEDVEAPELPGNITIHAFENSVLWQLAEVLHDSSEYNIDRIIRPGVLDTTWTCFLYIKQIIKGFHGVFNYHTTLILRERERVVGAAFCTFRLSGEAFIPAFFIHPANQGTGLGKLLLSHLIGKLREYDTRKISLCVSAENRRACSLYSGFDFKVFMRYFEILYTKKQPGPISI